MISRVGDIDGVPIYSDVHMDENRVLAGRKQGLDGTQYIVAHPKTADIIINILKRKQRGETLEDILNK